MTGAVALPARLDSAAAVALAHSLQGYTGKDVTLDAGAVSLLGALALQTLVVAGQTWRGAGLEFSLVNLSPQVARQIADLGLADLSLVTGDAP